MNDDELDYRAFKFAEEKHRGQIRKYTGEPYIVHPVRVATYAQIFKYTLGDPFMVPAAYLHDTVEDCGVKISEIQNLFGETVADYVLGLTEYCDLYPQYKGLVRSERHKLNLAYLMQQPRPVRILKGLDRYCNLLDCPLHDLQCVSFLRKKYLKESEDIVEKVVLSAFEPLAVKLTKLIEDLKEKVK